MTNFLEVRVKIFWELSHRLRQVELKAGDDTVPLESATNLPIDQNNKYYALVVRPWKNAKRRWNKAGDSQFIVRQQLEYQ